MLVGRGSVSTVLTSTDVEVLLAEAFQAVPSAGQRVLVIIPDGTRTAPIPLLFRLLNDQLGPRVEKLDFLIALGTHPPMSEDQIAKLVGMSPVERVERYPHLRIFNHQWNSPEMLVRIGVIPPQEAVRLTDGLLEREVPITLNRLVLEYDHLLLCGPVFPHEVAGFSGGAKYLFPGIAGPEVIDFTHWLGALVTSMDTIGIADTPVRRVIHRAAEFVPQPITCLALVLRDTTLHGLYIGGFIDAFKAAAALSAQLNIVEVPHAFSRVLSMPAARYDDLWTAAKAMYKTEAVVADGGEVIIYAPHLAEISYSHGPLIEQIGYHVRDYFLKQWDKFGNVPGSVLAHSTHVKGAGSYDATTGVEAPRIRVTLATEITKERCQQVNLGYLDYHEIDPTNWLGREHEGVLVIPNAGEVLYRIGSSAA